MHQAPYSNNIELDSLLSADFAPFTAIIVLLAAEL
jgi:hypothetical protein